MPDTPTTLTRIQMRLEQQKAAVFEDGLRYVASWSDIEWLLAELDRLTRELAELKDDNEAITIMVERRDEQLAALTRERDEVLSSFRKLYTKLQSSEADVTQLEAAKGQAERERDALRADNERLRVQVLSLSQAREAEQQRSTRL